MSTSTSQLVRRYLASQAMVEDFICSMVRNRSDAQDLCQEVAVTILEKELDPPADEQRFPAWCRGVARNHILHYWRSQRRSKLRPDTELLDLVEVAFTEQDPHAELWERRRHSLEHCLERLPEDGRQIMSLRFGDEEFPVPLIAERLRKSPVAIRKTISRLYAALRVCIEQRMTVES